ncbi:importin-11-like [Argopecten irradians]|uniref:importin-11-like n=1 Tax=Argopecten irradians TaxID=31199 RepID=UPI0037182B43
MESSSAGPLVLETLANACNQNACVFKTAEKQLQDWETQPGFYSILSEIFCKHELDVNVRWLAVMYAKNGVERYWRKNAPNAICESEKEGIKQRLLSNFTEPVPQIATQLAVLIGKIARLDCPRLWTQLLPTLFQAVRCPDNLIQERGLLVLHHVTKMLASKRLAHDRKLFEELTNEIFGFVLRLWQTHLQEFLEAASKHDDKMGHSLDKAILTCRILRKQIAYGFKDPTCNNDASNFLSQIFPGLKNMLGCRQSMWGHHYILEKCEKMIILLTKVLLDLLEFHPASYTQLIRPTLEFAVSYNFSENEKGLLFERFTVNTFNLIKGILQNEMYRPLKNEEEPQEPVRQEACKVKAEFFTYDTLSEICRRLVSQYFLLSGEDLSTWDSDPEEFCQEEVGDSYRYSLRPCTEALYMALFKEYRSSLIPVLLQMVQSVQGPCDPEDIATILRKDGVYNAVGLASFELFDEINFDDWFTSHLRQELQIKHVNYRIIRRRVIWLCGQWVSVNMSVATRPLLYQTVLPLLNKEEDLVVRIEASLTLKTAVDDFEFNVDQFLPYLNASFSMLFELLQEVRECDTKMQVLHVISFVIERVGAQIRPYTTSLIQYLPSLWQESADHNMLRCAILTTLIHIVQGFGSICSNMYDFLLPIIQMSTDVTQAQHIYLMEDGLELWHVTLLNAPNITEQLLQLFKNMSGLLDLGTENLRMCLKVIQAYIVLGPRDFMQRFSSELASSLTSMLTDLRTEGIVLILRVIELVFQSFPSEGPEVFRRLLPSLLKAIIQGEEHPMVLTVYLGLFARVLLQNPEFMWKFLNDVAPEFGKPSEALLGDIVDMWVNKIDCISQPERRKLVALGACSLLSLKLSTVMEKFSGIVCLSVEVLHDVSTIPVDEDTALQLDSLVLSDQDDTPEDTEQETEHDKRKRMLCRQDPVHMVPLKEYVLSQLTACQQIHGQDTFDKLMSQVDPEILQQLREFSG